MESFLKNQYVIATLRFIVKMMLAFEKRIWWHFQIEMPIYKMYWENVFELNSKAINDQFIIVDAKEVR